MTAAFIDTETTGLSPWPTHEAWEVALIIPGPTRSETVWQLPVDLGRADSKSLDVGHFHDRRWPASVAASRSQAVAGSDYSRGDPGPGYVVHPDDMHLWAAQFAHLTRGHVLTGANPAFDQWGQLDGLLRRHGACPEYHYRPHDIEAAGWGYLHGLLSADPHLAEKLPEGALDVPGRHMVLLDAIEAITGVDLKRDPLVRHTAHGDAALVERVYDLIEGRAW